ncbi:hypothetical protein ACFL7M_15400 [Thermodesulfobacteriota bacterium]
MRQRIRLGVIMAVLALIVNFVADTPFAFAKNSRDATPVGTTATGTIDVWGAGASEYGDNALYDVKITIEDVIRGERAWELIRVANASNPPPEEGFEYVLARMRIACVVKRASGNLSYKVKPDNFNVYDTNNHPYPFPAVLPPEPALIGMVFYSGDVHEGWIPFQVAKGHDRPLMFFFGGLWFQLFDQ